MNDIFCKVFNVSKRYDKNWVLRDVSFTVRSGEVLGLIGPNGAGKTTIFECLAGLIPADSGEVVLKDRTIAPDRRKEHLFYLPDGISPWPAQPVSWALNFFKGLYQRELVEISELTGHLKLDHLMTARIGTLSKGERKRLMLALGLLTPHPLLMLDEPFDGLDLRQTRDTMRLLKEHA